MALSKKQVKNKVQNYLDDGKTDEWIIEGLHNFSDVPTSTTEEILKEMQAPENPDETAAQIELIDQNFKFYRDTKSTRIYQVLDGPSKILKLVDDPDWVLFETQIHDHKVLAKWLFKKDLMLPKEPKQVARDSEDIWCYHKITVLPTDTPYTAWTECLSRMHDAEGFAAWVYGVYSGLYVGRQALWLHGEGKDGKTVMLKVVGEMFGEAYASICNNVIQNSRFAYINYVGKQMVGYPDCNVEKVMLTEFMKGISSGDPVSVEPKGGKSYEAILHAHPWINSNKAPHLLDEAHSLSRIFYVKIYPSTVNDRKRASFHDTIKEELPGFLFYAKQCWDKRALTDSQGRAEVISEIEETKEMVTSFIADDGDMYMLSTEVFEFHHEFNMDWSDFFDLAKEFYPNNRDNGNFKKYLVTKFSIKFDKTTRKVVGMRVK